MLGSTVERVKIPLDLVARVDGRNSIGRLAMAVQPAAGFLEPGCEGHSALAFSNIGPIPLKLDPSMGSAWLGIYRPTSAAERVRRTQPCREPAAGAARGAMMAAGGHDHE